MTNKTILLFLAITTVLIAGTLSSNLSAFADEDDEKLEVKIEIKDEQTRVKIENNDEKYEFTLDTTDIDEIFLIIEERTGLTRDQLENADEFKLKDEDSERENKDEDKNEHNKKSSCNKTITGISTNKIFVNENDTCTLENVKVRGNIKVAQDSTIDDDSTTGGTLILQGATIYGNIHAKQGSLVVVDGVENKK